MKTPREVCIRQHLDHGGKLIMMLTDRETGQPLDGITEISVTADANQQEVTCSFVLPYEVMSEGEPAVGHSSLYEEDEDEDSEVGFRFKRRVER